MPRGTASSRREARNAAPEDLGQPGSAAARVDPVAGSLPDPADSGIEHVVVVTMENRSFDHFLGWLPGADGKQAELSYVDLNGTAQQTYPLAPDFQGCGHPSPDHSVTAGQIAYNDGACDGWLRVPSNDRYAIGYYKPSDLAFLGQAAPAWTSFDRYFAAIMAETFPNRFYLHAAQTDRLTDSYHLATMPTIWDRLGERGLTGRYYFSDLPFVALWGLKYLAISRPLSHFLDDCARGGLPQVSFVDPRFLFEEIGTSNDDHPHADIRNGEVFLNRVYQAVTTGPSWSSTVLVITYDEWGGFFDHVPPEEAPDADPDHTLRGFRVPCLLISPWSRRGHVDHEVYDHTSILKLIEWRWGLAPLTPRDTAANNLAAALDFSRPILETPTFAVPAGPFGSPCPSGVPFLEKELLGLKVLVEHLGWSRPS